MKRKYKKQRKKFKEARTEVKYYSMKETLEKKKKQQRGKEEEQEVEGGV